VWDLGLRDSLPGGRAIIHRAGRAADGKKSAFILDAGGSPSGMTLRPRFSAAVGVRPGPLGMARAIRGLRDATGRLRAARLWPPESILPAHFRGRRTSSNPRPPAGGPGSARTGRPEGRPGRIGRSRGLATGAGGGNGRSLLDRPGPGLGAAAPPVPWGSLAVGSPRPRSASSGRLHRPQGPAARSTTAESKSSGRRATGAYSTPQWSQSGTPGSSSPLHDIARGWGGGGFPFAGGAGVSVVCSRSGDESRLRPRARAG